jgi:hypothetical protein
MRDFPNMSYTAVNNTNLALGQVMDMMNEFDTMDDFYESLRDEEKRAFRSLTRRIEEFASIIVEEEEEEMFD